jgi:hypothetical protein
LKRALVAIHGIADVLTAWGIALEQLCRRKSSTRSGNSAMACGSGQRLAAAAAVGCDRLHGAEDRAERLIVLNRRLKLAPLLRPGFFFF